MKTQAIVMDRPGGPEVLREAQRDVDSPGSGEVLLRQQACGVNYIDIQHRTGRYPIAQYPAVIGMEAAGEVAAVGPGVTEFKPGDRVAYTTPPAGAYAELRVMPAHRLVPVPASLDLVLIGASLLRGVTAQYLIKGTFQVARGHVILVHAAAGGVGQIVCQWASHLGATVIGTVGSDEKAELARRCGCDHVIVYSREDFVARVREITSSRGVDVVYDAVGPATFEQSLLCLKKRGMLVSYGTASGPLPPLEVFKLNRLGSLYLTSPGLLNYTEDRDELLERSRDYFAALEQGIVRIEVLHRYRFAQAAQAHIDLQARKTTGPIVLLP